MSVIQLTPLVVTSQALPGGPPGQQGPPGSFAAYRINVLAGASSYTAGSTDTGSLIIFTGTTLGVAFSLGPMLGIVGWWIQLKNENISGAITVTMTGGAVIDGITTLNIDPKCSALIISTGPNFETLGPVDGGIF